MNFIEQRERYLHDPEFHALVDRIYYLLLQGQFTIGELKGAVVYGGFKFESEQLRPIAMDQEGILKDLPRESATFGKVGVTREGQSVYRDKKGICLWRRSINIWFLLRSRK